MATQLDDTFLNDLGLGAASPDKKKAFLEQVLATLEGRIGERLCEGLTDDQLDEFERIVGHADDSAAEAEAWLKARNPDYEAVIEEELQKLKAELQQNLSSVMA